MRRSLGYSTMSSSKSTAFAEPPRAHVGLGANLGQPTRALTSAVHALAQLGKVQAVSKLYATDPVGGPPDQPPFRNAVIVWQPAIAYATPARALAALLAIERALGRNRHAPDHVRWGPRRIDLDLLAWEGPAAPQRSATPRAITPDLPHPRAFERPFVMIPWADAAPSYRTPNGHTVAEVARSCSAHGVMALAGAEAAAWERVTEAFTPPR